MNTVVWNTTQSLLWDENSALRLVNSDLMQLPDALREGNWSRDPRFEDPENGRLMPREDSPLIDTGIEAGVETDITGQSRPQGQRPDIGAYEFFVKNGINTWTLHY